MGVREHLGLASSRVVRALVERLEDRRLLMAAGPYISEFMAADQDVLPAQDGRYHDWIEIANPLRLPVNLQGYYLTDDRANLTKWQFPSVTIPGGGYLTVFALDELDTTPELHTNFALERDGEYLALVAADGTTILSEYADAYPRQADDISYGIIDEVVATPLLVPGAIVSALVPMDGALGQAWTSLGFNDAGWTHGDFAVGFEAGEPPPRVPGFTVRMVDVSGAITDIVQAKSLLAAVLPGGWTLQNDKAVDATAINYGVGGAFSPDQALPSGQANTEQYVLHVRAHVRIPAGTWSIDAASDDGFELTLPGVSFSVHGAQDATNYPLPVPDDTLVFSKPRGIAHSTGTFTLAAPLETDLSLVYYENGGGENLELSIASGQKTYADGGFALLGDNVLGWEVITPASAAPPEYASLIALNLRDAMHRHNASAYVRLPLGLVENPADFDALRLRVRYDDGFVAYLNGQEIARRHAPDALDWQSAAAGSRADADALAYEQIDVILSPGILNAGNATNVLAIHALNASAEDDDLLLDAELFGLHTNAAEVRYFTNPTPGAANDPAGYLGIVADTTFSANRGFYNTPFGVTIATQTQGAEIRYTLDGSDPATGSGMRYEGPISVNTTTILRAVAVKPGYLPSNTDTQTYLFLEDVIHQPANPAGFPALGTSTVHWDYEMDPQIVDDAAWGATIVDDLKSIPTLSLVMDVDDMFGASGIYVNPTSQGIAWERPVSMELIDADGGLLQVDAGIRIYGGVNRDKRYPKHSFRIFFRGEYGAGKLDYPLFGDEAADEFDSIVLRGHFNNAWPFWDASQRNRAQYIHDGWMSRSQLDMGQPGSHTGYVHLYINGLYWGLYSPTERADADFMSTYLGGDEADYDVIHDTEATDGTKTAWSAMQSLAQAGLATPESYAAIQQYVDVDNLIDYMLLNFYGGNQDWDNHNWYAGRKREDGAGFMFFSWDGERTLESLTHNKTGVNEFDRPSYIYSALRSNAEFRMRFADRVYMHLFNGGALAPEVAAARYMELAAIIDRAIVGESARWGDFCEDESPYKVYTRDDWVAQRDWEINTYFPARGTNLIAQLRAISLYPAIDPPAFNQHGGTIGPGFALEMTAPAGTVYYTLDGSDPRLPGGGVSSSASMYSGPVSLDRTATVRARVLGDDGAWSALHEATFLALDPDGLRIAEFMYNPLPGAGYATQEYEFLELMNTSARPADLTGVTLSGAIDYAFPDGFTMPAGARIVLAKYADAFASRYPGVDIAGVYGRYLDNKSGHLVLGGPLGTIFDLDYSDNWHSITDGDGYALVAVDAAAPAAQYVDGDNWRPSTAMLGAPGAPDPGYRPGAIVINELLPADGDAGWIELHNTTAGRIEIGGWFLSDDGQDLSRWPIPAGAAIEGGGFLVIDAASLNFDLSRLGGDVYLTGNDGAGGLGGYREHVDFAGADAGVTFGRHLKTSGGSDFTSLVAPTRGSANAAPLVGPVIISELMYEPLGSGQEFIELHNFSAAGVPLFDEQGRSWRIAEGVSFEFPPGTTIAPFGYILIVEGDALAFRDAHGVPPEVPVFTFAGGLQNGGENVKLVRPGLAGADGNVAWITVDQVHYNGSERWPESARGQGASLSRIALTAYGNDPGNWMPGPPGGTPGRPLLAPARPLELQAAGLSPSRIRLDWRDVAGEDGYRIERSADGIHFAQIAAVGPGVTSHEDGGLPAATFYTYRVSAWNGAGASLGGNLATASTLDYADVTFIDINADGWRYDDSATDRGTAWRELAYDDSAWSSGQALLWAQKTVKDLPATKYTPLTLTRTVNGVQHAIPTLYFRMHFTVSAPANLGSMELLTILDDGAVVYLNGNLVRRESVPTNSTLTVSGITRSGSTATVTTASNHGYKAGEIVTISGAGQSAYNGTFTITEVPTSTTFRYAVSGTPATPATGTIKSLRSDFGTYSSRGVGDAAYEGPYAVPLSFLRAGENVLAVEVHNTNRTSSDIVWGAVLRGRTLVPNLDAQATITGSDPAGGPADSATLTFNEAVTGLDLADLGFSRVGGQNLLTAAQTPYTSDGIHWTIPNLAALTVLEGDYVLSLPALGSGIRGRMSDRPLRSDAIDVFTVSRSALSGDDQANAWSLAARGQNLELSGASGVHVAPLEEINDLVISAGGGDDAFLLSGDVGFLPTLRGDAGIDRLAIEQGSWRLGELLGAGESIEQVSAGAGSRLNIESSLQLDRLELAGTGRAEIAASGVALRTAGLLLSDDAVLDLGDGVLHLVASDAAAKLAQVRAWIGAARGSAALWDGAGITSSLAQADALRGVVAAMRDGAIVVRSTWNGDININGIVDGDDYAAIDAAFLAAAAGFSDGDVNYDQRVDGDDYYLADSAYLGQSKALAPGEPAPASLRPAAGEAQPLTPFSTSTRPLQGLPASASPFDEPVDLAADPPVPWALEVDDVLSRL